MLNGDTQQKVPNRLAASGTVAIAVAILGPLAALMEATVIGSALPTGSAMGFGAGMMLAWFIGVPVLGWCAWHSAGDGEDAAQWRRRLGLAFVMLLVFQVMVVACVTFTTPNGASPYC